MKQNILARHPDDLTVNWAQHIVNQHCSDAEVSKVEIKSVDVGTTTRIRLKVAHQGPDTLPQHWFVKLPSLAWQARLITALPRLLETEVRFYTEIAQSIPLTKPSLLAAKSKFGRGSTLVLNDVSESGAVPGSPADALTATQAALVVKQLASFHAHFWNKADIHDNYRWLTGSVRRLEDFLGTALAVPLMKRGLRLSGDLIPGKLHPATMNYARYRRLAMRCLSAGPHTLVHHDCHAGNLFWNESGPGFLDWQLVRTGEGISDVAYLLSTALDPDIRRLHERSLVENYGQILIEKGIRINMSHLWDRYRAHLVYPFEAMIVTLAVGDMMPLESNLELIRRTAVAVEDLDAFSALSI